MFRRKRSSEPLHVPAPVGASAWYIPKLRFELEIHDRQQLELEIAYPLLDKEPSAYTTEVFLFVPRNVGVSALNYPREEFWKDLITYLRIDSPALTLSQLGDPQCETSPLHHLEQAIQELEVDPFARPRQPISALAKLYGHALRESVTETRQRLVRLTERLQTLKDGASERTQAKLELLAATAAFGHDGHQALLRFRKMRRRFAPLSGARPASVRETFENVDENATAYLVEHLERFARYLSKRASLHDGSGTVGRALVILTGAARQIAEERRAEGFSFPDPSRRRTAEFFTYRRGLIKKSMQQGFYLETRALRRDPYVRNMIAMVAAGLAAIWSLVAQVPGSLGDLSPEARWAFLLSAVFAYMLKDRIKELTRDLLGRRLRAYDHDNAIIGDNLVLAGLRGISGRARERMRWVLQSSLPQKVIQMRAHPRTLAGSDFSAEEVIAYTRALQVGAEPGQRIPPGFAVRDIVRLNLRQFMARVDEPLDDVSYYDLKRGRFLRVRTPKVYHLNLVIRVRRESKAGEPVDLLLCRHRVVLNKERIMRIEAVAEGAKV